MTDTPPPEPGERSEALPPDSLRSLGTDYVLRLSPWDDERVHAFHVDELKQVSARALCDHAAPAERLQVNDRLPLCSRCYDVFTEWLASKFLADLGPLSDRDGEDEP